MAARRDAYDLNSGETRADPEALWNGYVTVSQWVSCSAAQVLADA
jgi:hypothetical protein